jgi:hypothetical protein
MTQFIQAVRHMVRQGGGEMHIVEEYDLPGTRTHIVICDDFCRNASTADVEERLQRMANIIVQSCRQPAAE